MPDKLKIFLKEKGLYKEYLVFIRKEKPLSKNFKLFLRERNLSKDFKRSKLTKPQYLKFQRLNYAFNKNKTIKKRYKWTTRIYGDRRNFYIYRKGNKTKVVDRHTLKEFISTKKYNIKSIKNALLLRKETDLKTSVHGLDAKVSDHVVKVNFISRELNRAKKSKKLMSIQQDYGRPLNVVGRLIASVSFKSKSGHWTTVEGQSNSYRLLRESNQKDLALKEALTNAWFQINFSPQDVRVNWIRYRYYDIKD